MKNNIFKNRVIQIRVIQGIPVSLIFQSPNFDFEITLLCKLLTRQKEKILPSYFMRMDDHCATY